MEKDPYIVPGLVRGLAILQLFTPEQPELTLSQLARGVGVSRSAAFRTVHTLLNEGYMLASREGRHYRLGPSVLRLGDGYQSSRELLEIAQPALESLRNIMDWSAHLGVLDGCHVLYLIRQPASDGLSSLIHVGTRLPAATTAMGRVLLAHKTDAEIRRLYADQDRQLMRVVQTNLVVDRPSRYVIHTGSFERGLCSIAAPVFDMSSQAVAAVSVTKMTDRITQDVIDALMKAAMVISRGLGWKQTTPAGSEEKIGDTN